MRPMASVRIGRRRRLGVTRTCSSPSRQRRSSSVCVGRYFVFARASGTPMNPVSCRGQGSLLTGCGAANNGNAMVLPGEVGRVRLPDDDTARSQKYRCFVCEGGKVDGE